MDDIFTKNNYESLQDFRNYMMLYILRHGQTLENQKGILQGHMDGTLSLEGILQARKAAERLRNTALVCIYSSDLGRCRDTLGYVAKYHLDIPINLSSELREMDLGPYTGRPVKELSLDRIEGIEPYSDVMKRASGLLKAVYDRHPYENILFITHGGIIRVLECHFKGVPYIFEEMPANASLSIVEMSGTKDEIVLWNDISHL